MYDCLPRVVFGCARLQIDVIVSEQRKRNTKNAQPAGANCATIAERDVDIGKLLSDVPVKDRHPVEAHLTVAERYVFISQIILCL